MADGVRPGHPVRLPIRQVVERGEGALARVDPLSADSTNAHADHRTSLIATVRHMIAAAAHAPTATPVLQALRDATVAYLHPARVVVIADGVPLIRFVEASDPLLVSFERVQEALQVGPSHDCLTGARTITTDNLCRDGRWPVLAGPAAVAQAAAVVAVPLRSQNRCWGAVVIYSPIGSPPTPIHVDAVTVLADVAAAYLALSAQRQAHPRVS